MGDKITKTRVFMSKKEISNIKFLVFLIGISIFIFMDTSLFRGLNDIIKVIIYIGLWGTFLVLGIEILPAKDIGLKIKDIYLDSKMTWFEKGQHFGNIGMELLHKAGEMWQIGNEDQFIEKDNIKITPMTKPEKIEKIE